MKIDVSLGVNLRNQSCRIYMGALVAGFECFFAARQGIVMPDRFTIVWDGYIRSYWLCSEGMGTDCVLFADV